MKFKYNWNDKCKCSHSYELHKWDYANNKVAVEGCQICGCKGFVLSSGGEQ